MILKLFVLAEYGTTHRIIQANIFIILLPLIPQTFASDRNVFNIFIHY